MAELPDPVAILTHEHEFITKVVGALGAIAKGLGAGDAVDPDTLRGAVHFMREFADRCHHAKEEDLLFPAMEAKGVPESGCPLGALRHEHEQGRALVRALAEATEAYAGRRSDAQAAIVDAIGRIGELYTSHIWKEDNMVFPMVDQLLSTDERARLLDRFEAAEREIGAGHEALAEFALALERTMARG